MSPESTEALEQEFLAQIGEGRIWVRSAVVVGVTYLTAGAAAPVAGGLVAGAGVSGTLGTAATGFVTWSTAGWTGSLTADLMTGTPFEETWLNSGDAWLWTGDAGMAFEVGVSYFAKPGAGTVGAQELTFPDDPANLLPTVPRNAKGQIQPSVYIRIRPEQHAVKPGETFAPRHHGPHYHVEIRIDPSKSWNNANNVTKLKPPGYAPGEGTGFVPGERFPGCVEGTP